MRAVESPFSDTELKFYKFAAETWPGPLFHYPVTPTPRRRLFLMHNWMFGVLCIYAGNVTQLVCYNATQLLRPRRSLCCEAYFNAWESVVVQKRCLSLRCMQSSCITMHALMLGVLLFKSDVCHSLSACTRSSCITMPALMLGVLLLLFISSDKLSRTQSPPSSKFGRKKF